MSDCNSCYNHEHTNTHKMTELYRLCTRFIQKNTKRNYKRWAGRFYATGFCTNSFNCIEYCFSGIVFQIILSRTWLIYNSVNTSRSLVCAHMDGNHQWFCPKIILLTIYTQHFHIYTFNMKQRFMMRMVP